MGREEGAKYDKPTQLGLDCNFSSEWILVLGPAWRVLMPLALWKLDS